MEITMRHCKYHAGDKIANNNGSTYTVLTDTRNDETTVMSPAGWVCVAHDIALLDNGTIEWAWSEGIGFLQFLKQDVEAYCDMRGIDIIGGLEHEVAPSWVENETGTVSFTDNTGRLFEITNGRVFVGEPE